MLFWCNGAILQLRIDAESVRCSRFSVESELVIILQNELEFITKIIVLRMIWTKEVLFTYFLCYSWNANAVSTWSSMSRVSKWVNFRFDLSFLSLTTPDLNPCAPPKDLWDIELCGTRHRRNKQQYRPLLFPVEVSYLPSARLSVRPSTRLLQSVRPPARPSSRPYVRPPIRPPVGPISRQAVRPFVSPPAPPTTTPPLPARPTGVR